MTEEKKQEDGALTRTVENAFESYQAEDWEKLLGAISELMVRTRSASTTEKRTLSFPVFGLIAFITASIFLLVWMDKIEGDVLVSMGSVTVGYLLSFLGDSFGNPDRS